VRVRFADDEPLMIERTSFLPRLGELMKDLDLQSESIYAQLALHAIVFGSARHLISARAASTVDAELLRVRRRTPLIRVQRQAFSPAGEALEWSDERYLSRVIFAVENTASAGVVRQLA
jgi:GntR family transcriptional regulator